MDKAADARERYSGYLLPTLLEPFEVWLVRYEDGSYRKRYIGLYTGPSDLMVIVRENTDGSLLWNFMQRETRRMNALRTGALLYWKFEDRDVLAAFNQLLQRAGDLSPMTKEISETLLDHTEENFAQQGRPRWLALSPRTIEERTRKGYWPGAILQRRGELAAAVTPSHDPISAMLSVAKPYARIQQLGGQAGRGRKVTIPARPYLPITAANTLQPEA